MYGVLDGDNGPLYRSARCWKHRRSVVSIRGSFEASAVLRMDWRGVIPISGALCGSAAGCKDWRPVLSIGGP